jgi:hypothetical protein
LRGREREARVRDEKGLQADALVQSRLRKEGEGEGEREK